MNLSLTTKAHFLISSLLLFQAFKHDQADCYTMTIRIYPDSFPQDTSTRLEKTTSGSLRRSLFTNHTHRRRLEVYFDEEIEDELEDSEDDERQKYERIVPDLTAGQLCLTVNDTAGNGIATAPGENAVEMFTDGNAYYANSGGFGSQLIACLDLRVSG